MTGIQKKKKPVKGKVKKEMSFKSMKQQNIVYRCKFCDKEFKNGAGLIQHVKKSSVCISFFVQQLNEQQEVYHQQKMKYKKQEKNLMQRGEQPLLMKLVSLQGNHKEHLHNPLMCQPNQKLYLKLSSLKRIKMYWRIKASLTSMFCMQKQG